MFITISSNVEENQRRTENNIHQYDKNKNNNSIKKCQTVTDNGILKKPCQ